jgi:hypothetical protein
MKRRRQMVLLLRLELYTRGVMERIARCNIVFLVHERWALYLHEMASRTTELVHYQLNVMLSVLGKGRGI